jgi:peroxiredoxin
MFQKIIFLLLVSVLLCKQDLLAQEIEKKFIATDSLNEADSLPNFKFYTIKDSVEFTPNKLKKGLPVLFISFNTECDHCQKETEALKEYMDYFTGIQIIMVSRQSRAEILKFYKQNNIREYPIIMLQDPTNQLHKLFDFVYIPMIRQYNKKWKRIAAYNEQAPIGTILKKFDDADKK